MGEPPLRVLHVQHSLDPGGMENGVVNVANALADRGFEFHVACLSHSGSFAARMPEPGNVVALSKPEGFSPATVFKLARHIRSVRPDVIHSHNLGALIYSALATGMGHSRTLLHGEHGVPDDGPRARRRLIQRKLFYKSTARVHTVSHGLRDFLLGQGFSAQKIVALVNGVDTQRFIQGDKNSAREALGLPADPPVILIVGRLIASKCHRLLFSAFESVVEKWKDATLLVVGSGGSHAEEVQRAAVESPVSANIRLEGFQDPVPYYHAADLLVSPSIIEGLSNVVLEAMAAGVPALVHDACGNREVIDDLQTGFVTDLSTREALGNRLVSVLSDRGSLRAMGERARQSVISRFSIGRMADDYAQIYRQLAGESFSNRDA